MTQVSIIVLTYNPQPEKLIQTLKAAVSQKDVSFEIILSDDGSADSHFPQAEAYFRQVGFSDYRLVSNRENGGTVKNCLSGLRAAQGEYVFLTSPGDFLFDDTVLHDFYTFAKKQSAKMCFGNAVHYSQENGKAKLTSIYGNPPNPQIYAPERSLTSQKAAFFGRLWVTGCTFFRERSFSLEYFEAIAPTSVYTEDTPSTAFALAAGVPLCYYDRNIVWYECGGVSTGGNSKWATIIENDIRNSVIRLKELYLTDPCVDVAFANHTIKNRWKRLFYKLLRHPLIMIRCYWSKYAIKKTPLHCTDRDMNRLEHLLEND